MICSHTAVAAAAAPSFIEQRLYRYRFLFSFCVPYLSEGNCSNILYFIPDIHVEFRGENLYRARERKKWKFFCQLTSNDPYNARLVRFIAFPAGISKAESMTFRKITSLDDGFIGHWGRKTPLCCFITSSDVHVKRDCSSYAWRYYSLPFDDAIWKLSSDGISGQSLIFMHLLLSRSSLSGKSGASTDGEWSTASNRSLFSFPIFIVYFFTLGRINRLT